jgi:hypothetical protein
MKRGAEMTHKKKIVIVLKSMSLIYLFSIFDV